MIFFIILIIVVLFALVFILYPLRKNPKLGLLVSVLVSLTLYFGYNRWGGFGQWQNYLNLQTNQAIVKQLMQTPDGPEKLINKLKIQLTKTPNSVKGWYLLGRLSANRQDWSTAETAFAKASLLDPQDEAILVNYAQSLWENNQHQYNKKIRGIFKQLLKKNPNQADALAMLAMDFYAQKNYAKAIQNWEHLLKMSSPQSEEAAALRKAIAKARSLQI
jgi:cytochrome c-type biogenesis protein CcmH